LIDFNEKINFELRNAIETYNLLQEENNKLSTDKDSLLDYIEEIKGN
jgi:hypothetical protein